MHGYKTFLNAHAFAHHVNKDPEKAYGDVLVSVLNHKMKRVELIVAIDEEKCVRNGGQRTLEKIKAGEYPSTSMGCRVPFDVCSICGHKAKYRSEYCDHMRNDAGKIMADGRKVFVYNPYPRFFDISFVFIGADRTSFVLEKVANLGGIATAFGKAGAEVSDDLVKSLTVKNMFGSAAKSVKGGAKNLGDKVMPGRGITGMVAGGAVGAAHGAMSAPDDARDIGALKGALGGAVLGGVGNKFLRSSNMVNNVAGVAALGYGGSMAANALMPTMPAQTSSLQKTAANTMMGKALRKSSGTVQPYMGMRVKRKVNRQKTLKVRPITFSKLKSGSKKSKSGFDLQALAFDPLPSLVMDIVSEKDGNRERGFMSKRIEDKKLDKVAELKAATVTKLSDIFKDVNSVPMGRAVPMSVGTDPDMSCDELDSLASRRDLGQSLSGLGSAGIVLKPREFQRVVLVRSGLRDMADEYHDRGITFPEHAPVMRSSRIVIKGNPGEMIPRGVLDLIQNLATRRSSITPLALRKPMHTSAPAVKVIRIRLGENPVLDKVASLYNGYREDILLNMESMIKQAMYTPDFMSIVHKSRGFDDGKGPAFDAMSQVPLAYFSHAYWNRCCCDKSMSDKEFAEKFTEENPQIARYIAQQVATSCMMQ